MSRKSAEALKMHLKLLPLRDRIVELFRIDGLARESDFPLSSEERRVWQDCLEEVLAPMKHEKNSTPVPDLPKFRAALDAYNEFLFENLKSCGKDIANWKIYLDQVAPQALAEIHDTLVDKNLAYAQNATRTFHPSSFIISSMMESLSSLRPEIQKDYVTCFLALLEECPKLRADYKVLFGDPESLESQEPQKAIYTIRNFYYIRELQKVGSRERMLLNQGMQCSRSDLMSPEELRENSPAEFCTILDQFEAFIEARHADALQRDWGWDRDMTPVDVVTTEYRAQLISRLKDDPLALASAVRNIVKLYDQMQLQQPGNFHLAASYTHLSDAMKQVKETALCLHRNEDSAPEKAPDAQTVSALISGLEAASRLSASYICKHAERRHFSIGRKHFDNALAVIGALDYDYAALISEKINHLREQSSSSDKQLMDLDQLLKKNTIAPGLSAGYKEAKQTLHRVETIDEDAGMATIHLASALRSLQDTQDQKLVFAEVQQTMKQFQMNQ